MITTACESWLTMNREGIRRLAAEELGLPTSPYRFAETEEEFKEAVKVIARSIENYQKVFVLNKAVQKGKAKEKG